LLDEDNPTNFPKETTMLPRLRTLILSLLTLVLMACGAVAPEDDSTLGEAIGSLSSEQRREIGFAARAVDVRAIIVEHVGPHSKNDPYGELLCVAGMSELNCTVGVWDVAHVFDAWTGHGVPSSAVKEVFMAQNSVPFPEDQCEWGGPIGAALAEADTLPEPGDELSDDAMEWLTNGSISPTVLRSIAPDLCLVLCTAGVEVYCTTAQ
jgi:hypothetical protein